MSSTVTYISNIAGSLAAALKRNKQAVWVISVMFLLLVATCAATIFFVHKYDPSKFNDTFNLSERDYSLNPFGINDAIAICRTEAVVKLGSQFKHTIVDDLSTRVDTTRGIYLVVLKASTVTSNMNDQRLIYCHVDPKDYIVSYFKTHGAKRRQFTLSFF